MPVYNDLAKQAARLRDIQIERLKRNRDEAEQLNARSTWVALLLTGLSFGMGAIVVYAK